MKLTVYRELALPQGPRRPGAFHVIGKKVNFECDRLPFAIQRSCPTCGVILKPSRMPKPYRMSHLFRGIHNPCGERDRASCPLCWPTERKAQLVWIDNKRSSMAALTNDVREQGGKISWPLPLPPRDFKPNTMWYFLASSLDTKRRRHHNIFGFFLGAQLERVEWRSALTPALGLRCHTMGAKLLVVDDDDPDYRHFRKDAAGELDEEFA